MTSFLSNRDIYSSIVCGIAPQAKERLWIATADIKDMYVDAGGRDMVPFLEVLNGMVKRGVEVRLIHAKEPGPNWRDDFDRYPTLWTAMERMRCPHGAIPGKTRVQEADCYNLDVIISVGYRVKSQRGVEFRRWATSVLREYLVKGCAINRERMRQLGQTVEVMKRVANSLDTEQVLDVVQTYSAALDLLDGCDHQTIEKPKAKGRSVSAQGRHETHRLPYARLTHRDDRRVQATGKGTHS